MRNHDNNVESSTPQYNTSRGYRKEIDGLRAFAVLFVILFHFDIAPFSGGYVGVDIFFVISGYLITSIILTEKQDGRFSIVGFYERRARRILPALFVVVLACIPFAVAWMLPYQLISFSHSVIAVSLFSSNILFWQETGYFGEASQLKPLLHTWSLGIEEQYYLLFPLVVLALWGLGRKYLSGTLVLAGVASLLLSEWMWRRYAGANFFLLPTRGFELAIGCLITVWQLDKFGAQRRRIGELGAAAGLVMIVWSAVAFTEQTPTPSVYLLLPTLGAALIITFASQNTYVGRLLGTRLLVGIGLVSYSAYLWHQPVLAFTRMRAGEDISILLAVILILAVFGISYLSWRYVEVPVRNKKLLSRRVVFRGAAICSAALIALGFLGLMDHGFVSRFSADDRQLVSVDPVSNGRYVAKRFRALEDVPLDTQKKTLLIVGDSYAQDFVNAYSENGLLKDFSVSTHYIAGACGAIISETDITPLIEPSARASCASTEGLTSSRMKKQIAKADYVILAGSWKPWQTQFLQHTVDVLRQFHAKRVIVLGRKNFGTIAPLSYLHLPAERRAAIRNKPAPQHIQTNNNMRATLDPAVFVDTEMLLCGIQDLCPIFADGGRRLISFDGSHLTEAGAKEVGRLLFQGRVLSAMLEGDGPAK